MISAVLFDADGVIQRASQDWWSRLGSLVPADASAFVADLMAAEKPSLVGKGDFRDAVAEVLARWNSRPHWSKRWSRGTGSKPSRRSSR